MSTALGEPLLLAGTAELTLGADLAALSVLDASGTPISDASAPAYSALTGGAATVWDADRQTWVMTGLTLR